MERDLGIDQNLAIALGFPKLKYASVERERRWLCDAVPTHGVARAEALTDLYVTGARLRLRRASPLDGGPTTHKLGLKVDVDACTRLITSMYLSPEEFALLAGLPGEMIKKTRHYMGAVNGAQMSVDRFEGSLAGLILAEAEFEDALAMTAFPMPDFAVREVTDDPCYSGGVLAREGLPPDFR